MVELISVLSVADDCELAAGEPEYELMTIDNIVNGKVGEVHMVLGCPWETYM